MLQSTIDFQGIGWIGLVDSDAGRGWLDLQQTLHHEPSVDDGIGGSKGRRCRIDRYHRRGCVGLVKVLAVSCVQMKGPFAVLIR